MDGSGGTPFGGRRIGPDNVVYGSCGWASMWVYDVGNATARFDADAGSTQGPIVRADWTIKWYNSNVSWLYGSWSGSTPQFSTTWGVKRTSFTGVGTIYGVLDRLLVTLWDGRQCVGLRPWDWESVN